MAEFVDLSSAEKRMKGAVDSLRREFSAIRTGRANPAILDRVEVQLYGTTMPLKSTATISAPEARLLTVTPFDPNSIKEIEKAIEEAELGLNPQNDGKIIRLPIPELTEERRHELSRMARRIAEDSRSSVRNVRRDEMKDISELQKEGEISEDDERRAEEELQKLTNKYTNIIDEALEEKESELMEV